ncbi:hypothetical protein [Salinicola sp. CPA57]|uniref:hypothetical protein n=1 Tax=Salinicola sp. CPA57 TaxID=1949080 RepID=UPI000DA261D6|nr:hypothetical protein [Salinicola sp. CPA57]
MDSIDAALYGAIFATAFTSVAEIMKLLLKVFSINYRYYREAKVVIVNMLINIIFINDMKKNILNRTGFCWPIPVNTDALKEMHNNESFYILHSKRHCGRVLIDIAEKYNLELIAIKKHIAQTIRNGEPVQNDDIDQLDYRTWQCQESLAIANGVFRNHFKLAVKVGKNYEDEAINIADSAIKDRISRDTQEGLNGHAGLGDELSRIRTISIKKGIEFMKTKEEHKEGQ